MNNKKIKKPSELKNFEYSEYIEIGSSGWHLNSEAPEEVKKDFKKYLKHIDIGKRDIYLGEHYDNIKRFSSYWYQIEAVRKLEPESILEIGIGNGFTSDYLRKRDYNITTLDHNPYLKPDVLGSVLDLPFQKNEFELITCYEVLEHIPFENFTLSLKEINRVSKKNAIISVPDSNSFYLFHLKLPKIGEIRKLVELHKPGFLKKEMSEPNYVRGHYWEIGKKGYSLKKIKKIIRCTGFNIGKTYRPFQVPHHRFFILNV